MDRSITRWNFGSKLCRESLGCVTHARVLLVICAVPIVHSLSSPSRIRTLRTRRTSHSFIHWTSGWPPSRRAANRTTSARPASSTVRLGKPPVDFDSDSSGQSLPLGKCFLLFSLATQPRKAACYAVPTATAPLCGLLHCVA